MTQQVVAIGPASDTVLRAAVRRIRPRTIVAIGTLGLAAYVLRPQLGRLDDSVEALRRADWTWLGLCVALSAATYVFSALSVIGSVPEQLPLGATVEAQVASSFVNRISPANVGGMALNVRYLRKAGVESGEAVVGIGLNAVVGVVLHIGLLAGFAAWTGRRSSSAMHVPAASALLIGLAVALAATGAVWTTRWGRRWLRRRIVPILRQARASLVVVARSPRKVADVVGGSLCVTLCYVGAFVAACAAFGGSAGIPELATVYLGAAALAAAAPTPGGLGAMEAALVAGLVAIGTTPGVALAVTLGYRVATFWLPIVPGWFAFHHLQRHGAI